MTDIVQQLVDAARSTDRLVRGSPWQAVGTMALAGLAAGVLFSKGRHLRQRRAATTRNRDAHAEVSGG